LTDKTDYSDWSKKELVKEIKKLKKRKKYGIVWDEEREKQRKNLTKILKINFQF